MRATGHISSMNKMVALEAIKSKLIRLFSWVVAVLWYGLCPKHRPPFWLMLQKSETLYPPNKLTGIHCSLIKSTPFHELYIATVLGKRGKLIQLILLSLALWSRIFFICWFSFVLVEFISYIFKMQFYASNGMRGIFFMGVYWANGVLCGCWLEKKCVARQVVDINLTSIW